MRFYKYDGTPIDIIGGDGGSEELVKEKLTGKVLLAIGDSYTAGMANQFSALASKYGMIIDNVGCVGATISWRSTDSARRLYNIVDTAVSAYTNGKTISGKTYTAADVGIVHFMGGANDGNGIDAWIGTGIHETDKSTIYGSLNHIFSALQETFTGATIICTTQPSFWSLTVSSVTTDAQAQELGFADLAELQVMNDVQYSNYCQCVKEKAVRDIAAAYSIPIVDMFHEFPPVNNPTNRSAYWQNDKLHLTTAGYNLIANAIDKKIVSILGKS